MPFLMFFFLESRSFVLSVEAQYGFETYRSSNTLLIYIVEALRVLPRAYCHSMVGLAIL